MRLPHKKLLMLIVDGVDQMECDQLRRGFEDEGAKVLCTTPGEYPAVETVCGNRRGRDMVIDLPFEAVEGQPFDGLIIPDGLVASDLFTQSETCLELVREFHESGLPIFASGRAVEVLYRSRVLSECVLVREGEPIGSFIDQAVSILLDGAATYGWSARRSAAA